jgi:hypothetical protein
MNLHGEGQTSNSIVSILSGSPDVFSRNALTIDRDYSKRFSDSCEARYLPARPAGHPYGWHGSPLFLPARVQGHGDHSIPRGGGLPFTSKELRAGVSKSGVPCADRLECRREDPAQIQAESADGESQD